MTELNKHLYDVSYEALKKEDVPEYLADAVSRIVATDDPSRPNLGRSDIDLEICCEMVINGIANHSWEDEDDE